MKFQEVIGIDVSKSTLDACLHSLGIFLEVENSKSGYRKIISWVKKNSAYPLDQVLFCFEHTGLYSFNLACYLSEKNVNFILVPGLDVKLSLGIQRGKSDKVDAQKIALYAFRRKDEVTPYQIPEKSLTKLRQLLSLREKLVKQRAGYEGTLKEQSRVLKIKDNALLFSIPKKLVRLLDKQIDSIEQEINLILEASPEIKKKYELIISITGIGRQTALNLIVITNNFLLFDNHRKLASYAGVAPFPNSSGTSIKGRTKVSNLANKKLKSLLSSCATSAIQHDPELKLYFKKRTEKGIHKMNTINAVRNKLLARVFAVVRRETPYVNMCKYVA